MWAWLAGVQSHYEACSREFSKTCVGPALEHNRGVVWKEAGRAAHLPLATPPQPPARNRKPFGLRLAAVRPGPHRSRATPALAESDCSCPPPPILLCLLALPACLLMRAERLTKAWARESARFERDYNDKLLNGLVMMRWVGGWCGGCDGKAHGRVESACSVLRLPACLTACLSFPVSTHPHLAAAWWPSLPSALLCGCSWGRRQDGSPSYSSRCGTPSVLAAAAAAAA